MKPRYEIIEMLGHDLGNAADDSAKISKAIYKGTRCGAYVNMPDPSTIEIGSIVENGDQEIGPRRLRWPFTPEEFWAVVSDIDDEACRIYDENEEMENEDDTTDLE